MKDMKNFILSILLFLTVLSCQTEEVLPARNFRNDMRNFIIKIASYARNTSNRGANKNFIVIPQNGQELITYSGEPDGMVVRSYCDAIDGTGREDLYYGYNADNEETPASICHYFESYLNIFKSNGKQILVIDYCRDHVKMDKSYAWNAANGYLSFAAPERMLNVIPYYPPHPYPHTTAEEAAYPVTTLSEARNFLYLINPDNGSHPSRYGKSSFPTKSAFLTALAETNDDIIIMDAFYGSSEYTPSQIQRLKTKKSGGRRLVIAYMSIGEAEDYRYYWKIAWNKNPPAWLDKENPDWKGNYKVKYWEQGWQEVIVSGKNSYVQKIMNAGFDGVYLDIVDAFEYFENH